MTDRHPTAPFGRVVVAMITPFTATGDVDYDGAQRLADHLVSGGCDGLVINGTTGEAPTTTDREKDRLVQAVVEAVGDRARVIAGVGTHDTAHTLELAQLAEKAGADALLVVTPYYSKPPQAGLLRHFRSVADGTGLPVIVYDIPGRAGVPVTTDTLARLAEHERIVAVKDAKDDLGEASWVMRRTDLAVYCGSDMLNLPHFAIGGVGCISVVGHFFAADLREMYDAFTAGDVAHAAAVHRRLLPAYTGLFRTQGVITTKAALTMLGLPAGPVRSPLIDASDDEIAQLRTDLAAAGLTGLPDLPPGSRS